MNRQTILTYILSVIVFGIVFLVFDLIFEESIDIEEIAFKAIFVPALMKLLQMGERYYLSDKRKGR